MTARDMSRAITPGSIPYGDRQTLESNLPQALSAAEQQSGGGGGASAGGMPLVIPEDPLGALLSGEVAVDPNEPSTSGLSVGPGPGPAQAPDVMLGSRAEKLRRLASESSSPLIRNAARNELRRMSREGI